MVGLLALNEKPLESNRSFFKQGLRKSETNIELATFGRLTSLAPGAPCGGAKQQPQTETPAPISKPFLLQLECEKLMSSMDR